MLTGSMGPRGRVLLPGSFFSEEAQLRLLSPTDMWYVSTGAFIIAHISRKTGVGTCHRALYIYI